MRPPHWLPGIDARTQAALDFIDAEIARENLRFGYRELAAHLEAVTGETHTIGMVAGLLDTHAARETREWWRQREVAKAA
jgi:hypothetical protein